MKMDEKKVKCFICQNSAEIHYNMSPDLYIVQCTICGKYNITVHGVFRLEKGEFPRYLLSSVIKNRSLRKELTELDSENIDKIIESEIIPANPVEKINLIIQFVMSRTKAAGEVIRFNLKTLYSDFYCIDGNELLYLLKKGIELGYFEKAGTPDNIVLDLKGWEKAAELQVHKRNSNLAFVAMWFDETLDEIWKSGFYLALDSLGYKPVRIDKEEHNEKICDKIIAAIRQSTLCVGDFTGDRGGVYYETGFADGLGIPVIRTCKDEKEWIEKLHFDTRQYNHILWKDAEDLRIKLIDRIKGSDLSRLISS